MINEKYLLQVAIMVTAVMLVTFTLGYFTGAVVYLKGYQAGYNAISVEANQN